MNNNRALADELSALVASETRGLIRHAAVAQPHVTPATHQLYVLVKRLADVGLEHSHRLVDLMQTLEIEPRPVPYAAELANFHFVTLESLRPAFIHEKRQQVAAYERVLGHLKDHPDAARVVGELLEDNRQHLDQLQEASTHIA